MIYFFWKADCWKTGPSEGMMGCMTEAKSWGKMLVELTAEEAEVRW
ncbi:hypothetical protein GCM10010298_76970 [Streptomyces microflavus]|nr:hypothetical protein GCM10010298_76970 [Streptomyces microflavus]GGZ31543.1 hypothetical protein GCM10010300_87070 [Streptomyces olivaceoviridis]